MFYVLFETLYVEYWDFKYVGAYHLLICSFYMYVIYIYMYKFIINRYIWDIPPRRFWYLRPYCTNKKIVQLPVWDLKPWLEVSDPPMITNFSFMAVEFQLSLFFSYTLGVVIGERWWGLGLKIGESPRRPCSWSSSHGRSGPKSMFFTFT